MCGRQIAAGLAMALRRNWPRAAGRSNIGQQYGRYKLVFRLHGCVLRWSFLANTQYPSAGLCLSPFGSGLGSVASLSPCDRCRRWASLAGRRCSRLCIYIPDSCRASRAHDAARFSLRGAVPSCCCPPAWPAPSGSPWTDQPLKAAMKELLFIIAPFAAGQLLLLAAQFGCFREGMSPADPVAITRCWAGVGRDTSC